MLPDPSAVAQEFAIYLMKLISAKTQCHIALSGGSTPKLLFDLLSENYAGIIDWSKVYLYWGDERCVPPDHEESNYKMTNEHLLSKIAMPEDQVYRIRGEDEPDVEAERYASVIEQNIITEEGLPRFDLIILGMGADGHTASIFPHQMHLLHSEKICEVAMHPDSRQKRITLTGPVINNADNVSFLVTGEPKADKIRQIMGKSEEWKQYPSSFIQPEHGTLSWFLDAEAAKKL